MKVKSYLLFFMLVSTLFGVNFSVCAGRGYLFSCLQKIKTESEKKSFVVSENQDSEETPALFSRPIVYFNHSPAYLVLLPLVSGSVYALNTAVCYYTRVPFFL